MPFEIVRNDIVNMQVDAIVNTANPNPVIGYGCDAGIHKKAGPRLLEARRKIGPIAVGEVAVTPGFDLNAKYVLHAVGPVWQGGDKGEERLLRSCYDRALELAWRKRCRSIAFPLLSAGNYGFPKDRAIEIAVNAFSSFLLKHDMQIYLVVFNSDAFLLSEKLFHSVASYIDENYILEKEMDEYGIEEMSDADVDAQIGLRRSMELRRVREECEMQDSMPLNTAPVMKAGAPCAAVTMMQAGIQTYLKSLLERTDAGFSETLLKLIDRTGKKDSEIYKRANVDRKLFSKIRNNKDYRPSKTTALAFAVALELDLEETQDFIGRAGYALTHSSKLDIIVEYFIRQRNYNIHEINIILFEFDQSRLGIC